jgi:pimeloyl-ACP methyl ester carboxylesterase
MGGSVSIALASARPDIVRGVVLVDSPLVWPPDIQPALRQGAEMMAGPDGDATRRGLINSFFIEDDDAERSAAIAEQMMRTPSHVASSAFFSIASWDLTAAAAQVKAPVLAIMAGTMPLSIDEHFPAGVVDSLWIGRTVGAGHYIQLEVPEQVNAMIDRFLALNVKSDTESRLRTR